VARLFHRVFPALLAAIFVSCASLPEKGDTGIKPLAFDLWDVHCPSGLRVIFERAPGSHTAGVTAVVGSGSVEDPPGREGLAHLVEHLTYRSRDAAGDPVQTRLRSLGAKYNGETDHDTTTYHEYAPAPSLRDVVTLEGARMADPLRGVDEATFAIERDIVRNELRERDETHWFAAAYHDAFEAAFPAGHPYARHETHDSLSAITMDDARRFVAAHYRPQNVTMVVVGDMDLSQVDAFVRETLPPALYGDPAHARPIAKPPAVESTAPTPPPDTRLRRAHAAVVAPELWIAWPLPGGRGAELSIARMWSSLTMQNFHRGRFDDNDIAGVQLFVHPGVLGNVFVCRVELTQGSHPEKSLKEVVAELPWIGGEELYLSKRFRGLKLSHLRGIAYDAESVITRSRERADYAHFAGGASAYGALIEQVKSIDADQARDFAERYLTADRARAVLVEPLGDDAEPARPIPAAANLLASDRVVPLAPATLAHLANVRHLEGLRRSRLDSGLEVVVLRRPGAPVVTATLSFHVDRTTTATGLHAAADEALELRLEESPSDFGISYSMDVGTDATSATVRAGAGNLERALGMLAFGTRSIDFDWPSDKFTETKVPLRKRHEASPDGRAERALWKELFGQHPFGAWPTVDQIASHKASELESWLGGVISPANGVLIIVGDVDPSEAEAAARSTLSSLGGSAPAVAAPTPVQPTPRGAGLGALEGRGAIVTHRPGATQTELELRCLLEPADARRDAAHDVAASMVGGELEDRLRQTSGSTYGTHVWASTLRGGTAMLTIKSNVDNGRLPLALTTLRAFWKEVVADGVSEAWVHRARDKVAVGRLLRYESSAVLASELEDRWNQGWPLETIDQVPAILASVEKPEVDAALRTCAGNLVFGLTGDQRVIQKALASSKPGLVPASGTP
jgi:zinc protease